MIAYLKKIYKLFAFFFPFLLLAALFYFFATPFSDLRKEKNSFFEPAKAAALDNLSGWAWSENIGWISFNSSNCDVIPRPSGCPAGTIGDYGVNIDSVSGLLTGSAWSENIGWIKFNPDLTNASNPSVGAAKMDGSGKFTGWARACAGTTNGQCTGASRTDGWDGWIKMSEVQHDRVIPFLNYDTYFKARRIETADFNGDGAPDIVVSGQARIVGTITYTGGFIIYMNNGSGTSFATTTYLMHNQSGEIKVQPGDFDQDGDIDLAVLDRNANYTTNTKEIKIYLNNGFGEFSFDHGYDSSGTPSYLEKGDRNPDNSFGDFNRDGAPDLAATKSGSTNGLIVLLNKNDTYANFDTEDVYATGSGDAMFMAVGDLDGKNGPDLAVMIKGSVKKVRIYLNQGDGNFYFLNELTILSNPTTVAFGDIDRDNDLDLAVITDTKRVYIYKNNGFASFSYHREYPTGFTSSDDYHGVFGDMNNDNWPDLVFSQAGQACIMTNTGDGNFLYNIETDCEQTFSGGVNEIALADFNLDGKLDIAMGASFSGKLTIMVNGSNPAYGARRSACGLIGEAWGSNVVGWIRFAGQADDGSLYGVNTTVCEPLEASDLSAAANGCSKINLSWTDNSNNEDEFILERAENSNFTVGYKETTIVSNTKAGTGTIEYTVIGLQANKTYYFRVRASNSIGESSVFPSSSPYPSATTGICPIATIEASKETVPPEWESDTLRVNKGENVIFRWGSTDADYCEAEPPIDLLVLGTSGEEILADVQNNTTLSVECFTAADASTPAAIDILVGGRPKWKEIKPF